MKLKWILLSFLLLLTIGTVVFYFATIPDKVEAVATMPTNLTTQAPVYVSTEDPAMKTPTPRPARTPRSTLDPAVTPSPTPKPMSFIGGGEAYEGIDGLFYTVQEAAEPMELIETQEGEFDLVGSYEAVKGQETEFGIRGWEWEDAKGRARHGVLLVIGDASLPFGWGGIGCMYCVDIDRTDPYKELFFIFSRSIHAADDFYIVRYDGENLWLMCEGIFANRFIYYNSEGSRSETCVTLNGEGIVTVPSDRFDLVKPVVVTSMWKEVDGMLVQTPGTGIVLGKRYTLKKGELFFQKGKFEAIDNIDDFSEDVRSDNEILSTREGEPITFIKEKTIMDSEEYGWESHPLDPIAYYVKVNGQYGFLYDYPMWFTELY